ncbi:MAG: DUF2142 domain-containing protein [Rhodospirillales bacterium]|nr:DUF2142 domain-containing protein [Rhodospirillales bacterium]
MAVPPPSRNEPSRAGAPAVLAVLLGLLGVVMLTFLTPPFQVPDEQQHFARAYQIATLTRLTRDRDGEAGAVLPAGLTRVIRHFLGTTAFGAGHGFGPEPLARTLAARAVRLHPGRRVFIAFPGAAEYAPLAYLPQVGGIALGRAFGAGPLALLWCARLASGLCAIMLIGWAIWTLPFGAPAAMVLGLLPMALYEYSSASIDGSMIGAGFLLAALGARAVARGRWTGWELAVATAAMVLICTAKPVYAPLSLVALPACRAPDARGHHLRAIALLLGAGALAAIIWFGFADHGHLIGLRAGVDAPAQAHFVLAHPWRYVAILGRTLRDWGWYYLMTGVGMLGWLMLRLPPESYWLAGIGLAVAVATRARPASGWDPPAWDPLAWGWWALLLAGGAGLVLTAMDICCTPVGGAEILGAQGRYALPLLGLCAAMLGALPMPRVGRGLGGTLLGATALTVGLNLALTVWSLRVAFALF